MTKKVRRMYIRTMIILCLPLLYVICLYLYSSRNIAEFLYPMIGLGIVMWVISFWLIYKLFYGKNL